MERKECSATYHARWTQLDELFRLPPDSIRNLTLEVRWNPHDLPRIIMEFYYGSWRDIRQIKGRIERLSPRLSLLKIDFSRGHAVVDNREESRYLVFQAAISGVTFKKDGDVAMYLNRVAAVFNYPSIHHFIIDRRYVVRTKVGDEFRWVDEGRWVAQRAMTSSVPAPA